MWLLLRCNNVTPHIYDVFGTFLLRQQVRCYSGVRLKTFLIRFLGQFRSCTRLLLICVFTSDCLTCVVISNPWNISASILIAIFIFLTVITRSKLLDIFDFTFPGGRRSGLVSANPDPGESDSFGLGRERSSGSSQDRVRKDGCVRRTCHTAHPFLQTGEDNTNLGGCIDKWFISLVTPV